MEETQMPRVLKLEDVLAGIRPIVESNPTFIYPQQEQAEDEDERCACVEVDADEDDNGDYLEEHFLYADCQWHLDDDNTCRYVQ